MSYFKCCGNINRLWFNSCAKPYFPTIFDKEFFELRNENERNKKLSAITLTAVLAFSSTVTAFGAEVTESVSYSKWGSKTVCEALGIDTAEYYKWIVNHDNDSSNDYQTYTVSKIMIHL